MWNLERNIRGFEPESVLIIISYSLMDIEKRGDGCRLHALHGIGISCISYLLRKSIKSDPGPTQCLIYLELFSLLQNSPTFV